MNGIITVTSGKLPSTEWERVKGYSENGLRKYKVFSAILVVMIIFYVVIMNICKKQNNKEQFIRSMLLCSFFYYALLP